MAMLGHTCAIAAPRATRRMTRQRIRTSHKSLSCVILMGEGLDLQQPLGAERALDERAGADPARS